MASLAYNGLNGASYVAGRKIGEGGEGTIYEVQGSVGLVLKIYKEAIDSDKEEKLRYMAAMASPELQKFAAWPVDVVTDPTRKVVGFVMKKLVAFVPLHMLFSPMDRKKIFPDKGYNFLVHVARNLATAFHQIHRMGIVAGDINEANILVSNTGMIALIDCDSFQIKNGTHYHFCEVGIPRYTPPELLERGSFEQVVRTVNTDSFSLATLIFQLLFLGRAPFTGINLSSDDLEEEKAIKLGEFAYSLNRSNKKLTPAKFSLDLNSFTQGIIKSFHQAFETRSARPEPAQWITDLDELGKELNPCSRSKLHFYPGGMQKCPWCEFKDKAGIVYFFDDSYLRILPELDDIEKFVSGFRLQKLELKTLPSTYSSTTVNAAAIPNVLLKKHYRVRSIQVGIVLLSLIFGIAESPLYGAAGLAFLLLYNLLSAAKRQLKAELGVRKAAYESLKQTFTALVAKHNDPAELKRYNQSATKLSEVIVSFRRLPEDLIDRKRKIEENYYNIKYQVYLLQFDVLQHPIPSFGSAKKKLIHDNGIKTAADIFKLKNVKVPGIGPKNIQVLFDWQRHIGAGFVYVADSAAIDRDISVAANEIFIEKLKLQNSIKAEYKSLVMLRDQVVASTELLERQYVALGTKLYQAELDFRAFEKLVKRWF